MKTKRVFLCVSLAASVFGCRTQPSTSDTVVAPPGPAAQLDVSLGEFECGEEFPSHARCGDFEVFENREAQTGRTIPLRWVLLPALGPQPRAEDPVFVFAGGPGQAASQLVVLADSQLAGVNLQRDLVFVDQRGTGSSNGLQCMASTLPDMLEGMHAPSQRAALEACRANWDADLRHYGTTTAMADIDQLRAAMGYAQINIWGVSYGTRAAFEYMRRHEDSVRSVLLWGLAPPELPYLRPFPDATQAALDQALDACVADADCASVLPEPLATVDAIRARLEANPAQVELIDPRSGQLHTIEVDPEMFMTGVRLVLYDASWTANLPSMLAAARDENYRPLMDFVVRFVVAIYSQIYIGMNLAVTCSEDVPRMTPADLSHAAASRSGDRSLREFIDVCADWPKSELAADWADPVRSDVPVLLMNGGADPATPDSSAELAARSLSNARVIRFTNVSHGTSNAMGCVNAMIVAFLDSADPEGLDSSCAGEGVRPAFEFGGL